MICLDLLKIGGLNADVSTKLCLDKINVLLDTYAHLKKINKDYNKQDQYL